MISIAVDIGGTFTEWLSPTRMRGGIHGKGSQHSGPPRGGRRRGRARTSLELAGRRRGDVERFIHGTTVGTNAVLEQKGAVTAVLTTEGFEDVLEIGRHEARRTCTT